MIIIGEKINGSIPSVAKAIAERDEAFLRDLAVRQAEAGSTYIDVCASVEPEFEYDTLAWMLNLVQDAVDTPIAVDSPDANCIVKCLPLVKKPGLVNSVSMEGDKVDVSAKSKGHGFSGVIQRWNQHTGPMSHGSGAHRVVGSMGASSSPSHVFKNKHMPGQWGNEQVTVQNLEIVRVDTDRNVLLIKGAVPGAAGALLTIKQSVKSK